MKYHVDIEKTVEQLLEWFSVSFFYAIASEIVYSALSFQI